MNLFIFIIGLFIIVCLVLIWYSSTYNRYQTHIIRMNEAEAAIDSILRKRFDLLNKSINIIKSNTEIEGEVLDVISKLRSKKLTNFELDRSLYDAINEFNIYKEDYPALREVEAFTRVELGLNESESEIYASRRYYNDIITDYNKMARTFPSNIIALISRYEIKPYFDGKNMNDDILNDFKL